MLKTFWPHGNPCHYACPIFLLEASSLLIIKARVFLSLFPLFVQPGKLHLIRISKTIKEMWQHPEKYTG